MRNFKFICSAFGLSLLAGCGGGGGGGASAVNSTPAPPDSVSKSASLIGVSQTDDFAASIQNIKFSVTKGSGSAAPASSDSSSGIVNTSVHYDAAAKSYTLQALSNSTFSEANRVAAKSNSIYTVYEKTSGSRSESFLLFNPGASNPSLALTYTSYGAWQTLDDGSSLGVKTSFFAFGTRTSSAELPRTGSASYTTIIDGQYADSSGVYALGGSSNFSADFGAATVAVNLNPVGTNVLNSSLKNFGTFSGSGTIDTASARFNTNTMNSGDFSMSVRGYFYGPGAAEIGGTFSLTGFSAGAVNGVGAGAIVGKKN
jgi:hypothetical protein